MMSEFTTNWVDMGPAKVKPVKPEFMVYMGITVPLNGRKFVKPGIEMNTGTKQHRYFVTVMDDAGVKETYYGQWVDDD
jgi:hypothetical protein